MTTTATSYDYCKDNCQLLEYLAEAPTLGDDDEADDDDDDDFF